MVSITDFAQYNYSRKQLYPRQRYIMPFIKSIQKLNIVDNKDSPDKTPDFWIELKKNCTNIQYIMNEFVHLTQFTPIKFVLTAEEAIKDLEKIKSETKHFELLDENTIFFVKEISTYYPEQDKTFSFGYFNFKLMTNYVSVEPHSDNTKRNGEYHPYVHKYKLCLGQYLGPYVSAYNEMRYYDAYHMVTDVMTRYGGDELNGTADGPHNPFHLWIGKECEVCGGSYDVEDMYPCTKTKLNICKNCLSSTSCTDENTGDIYLPQYIASCTQCGKNAFNVKSGICGVCRRNNS